MAESVSPLALHVTITSDGAADIGSLLFHAMKRAGRENHEMFTADSWRTAHAITELGKAHCAGSYEVVFPVARTTDQTASLAIVDDVIEEIDVATFAKRTGRKASSVRRSLHRGTLAGRRDGAGHWWICTENEEAS